MPRTTVGKVTSSAPLAAGWVLKGWSPVAVDDGQHVVLGDIAGKSVASVVGLSGMKYVFGKSQFEMKHC